MPLYVGDYLASTQHLSAEQSGAYLHLLMHEWKTGPLPLDLEVLRRISRVERDAWGNAWVLLEQFFVRTQEGFVQSRLELEKTRSQEKRDATSRKARAAAEKRWGASETVASSNAPSSAQALLEECPSPSPSPLYKRQRQKPTRAKREEIKIDLPEWIDGEAWNGYLEVRRKKRAVMSERALLGVIARLTQFRERGHKPNEILATSLRSNWTDVYEPKGESHGKSVRAANPSAEREADCNAAIDAAFRNVAQGDGADEERGGDLCDRSSIDGEPSRAAEMGSREARGQTRPQLVSGGVRRLSA